MATNLAGEYVKKDLIERHLRFFHGSDSTIMGLKDPTDPNSFDGEIPEETFGYEVIDHNRCANGRLEVIHSPIYYFLGAKFCPIKYVQGSMPEVIEICKAVCALECMAGVVRDKFGDWHPVKKGNPAVLLPTDLPCSFS